MLETAFSAVALVGLCFATLMLAAVAGMALETKKPDVSLTSVFIASIFLVGALLLAFNAGAKSERGKTAVEAK